MNEERSNLRRFCLRVKLAGIPAGKLIAAKKGFPFAPTAAANQRPGAIGDEICPIKNKVGINAEDRLDGPFDLLLGVSPRSSCGTTPRLALFDCFRSSRFDFIMM